MVAYSDKVARVYMSTVFEDLKNLAQYTDPLNLGDTLKDMSFNFNGMGAGTYEVKVTFINPALQFEDLFLQLYRMYFIENTSSQGVTEIDDPTLNFYLRWGYGDLESDGLSRIMQCKLTDIKYNYTNLGEKVISLTLTDNLTFAMTQDPAHTRGLDNVVSVDVDCLVDGVLRLPGEVIGEILSKYVSTFAGVKPVSFLYDDNGPGHAIDSLYGSLTNQIAKGNLNGNIAIKGMSEEVDVFADNFIGLTGPSIDVSQLGGFSGANFDIIPGATWDNFKVGNSPSDAHRVAAYQMLMSQLGLNFSIGYKEDNTISNTEDSTRSIVQDERTQISAEQQMNAGTIYDEFDFEYLSRGATGQAVFTNDGTSVGKVDDILSRGDGKGGGVSGIFPPSCFVDGKYMFSPGGVYPVTYQAALYFQNPSTQYTVGIPKDKYYTDSSRKYYVSMGGANMVTLDRGLREIAARLNNPQDPSLNQVLDVDAPTTIHVNSKELYATLNLSKSPLQTSLRVVEGVIGRINKEVLPGGEDEGDALSVLQAPWSSLTEEAMAEIRKKLGAAPVLDSDSIMLISSRQNIRSLFAGDVPQTTSQLALQSFPELQEGNTLTLSVGYNNSITTGITFNESIIAMYPDVIRGFNTFKDIAEVFVSKGEVREWTDTSKTLITELVTLKSVDVINEVAEIMSAATETEFYGKYINFVTRAEGGEFGDEYKGIVLSRPYASAFARLANSDRLRDFFGDFKERPYSFERADGSTGTSTLVDFKSVSMGSTLKGFISDGGDLDVSEYFRIQTNKYLYSAAAFRVTVAALGIPEISNPLLDLGGRGSRRVNLKISETRLPGSSEHWLSGFYNIIGYTHTYDVSKGYTMSFNLVRNPIATKGNILNAG